VRAARSTHLPDGEGDGEWLIAWGWLGGAGRSCSRPNQQKPQKSLGLLALKGEDHRENPARRSGGDGGANTVRAASCAGNRAARRVRAAAVDAHSTSRSRGGTMRSNSSRGKRSWAEGVFTRLRASQGERLRSAGSLCAQLAAGPMAGRSTMLHAWGATVLSAGRGHHVPSVFPARWKHQDLGRRGFARGGQPSPGLDRCSGCPPVWNRTARSPPSGVCRHARGTMHQPGLC